MKPSKLKLLLILCIAISIINFNTSFAQSGCNYQWGSMRDAFSGGGGVLSFRVQTSNCISGSPCGWPLIALYHSFPYSVSITLKLRGYDCNNKVTMSTFYASNLRQYFELKDNGNSHTFQSVSGVVSAEVSYHNGNDYYRLIYDGESSTLKTLKNGKPTY